MAPDRSDRSLLVNFDNTNNTNNEDDELEITGMIDISEKDDVTIVSNFPDNTIDNDNVIVSSTDWSSLSKSCKRAKNDFKDMDSGLTVVRNMFMTHLRPLTAVLTLYSKRCCSSGDIMEEGKEISLNELKSRTTETKRALRFAMSCLAPPRPSGDNNNESGTPSASDVTQDGVDIYRVDRQYRQELQEAAVKGFTYTQRSYSLPSLTASTRSANSYNSYNEGGEEGMARHHYGLQIPLVEIINDTNYNTQSQQCHVLEEEINDPALFASIERDKRTVRILAARMLCNLVTDNPLAAELVLKDIPFSPNPDLKERRLATSIFGSREQAQRVDGHQGPKRSNSKSDDEIIFWSDLISITAKVQPATAAVVNNGKGKRHGDDQSSSEDREELAAVSAALHNLLTSLEARESLLELDDEMKRRRREIAKQQQNIHLSSPQRKVSTVIGDDDEEDENKPLTPMDAGFEIASDGTLLNALLRNILPTKAVLMQAKRDKERSEPSRPQFKSSSTTADDNLSDSATEWISLILERLASRVLLPKMLQSAGGTYMKSKTVTPEQVVLVSCIRQAVDDYHSALTSTGETGGFGRRRLSIAAKSAGITISSRPHPLWGRADPQAVAARDSRTAVPVLLSLANEAEEIRIRENELKQDPSVATYDGELNCTSRIIVDLVDILAQSLGRHAGSYLNGFQNQRNKPQCFIADARSVLGRETTIIKSCCKDLGRILDMTLAKNQGKKAREMELSEQDQHAAIVNVRLIGNIIFQCRHNQDLIRITPVPMLDVMVDDDKKSAATAATNEVPTERTGLHVILSTTSLAPVCFTLREWCIVAIRNAMDGNAANAETCRRLEANQVMDDTPELQKLGVKMSLDDKGKVQISRRDNDDT